MQNRLKTLFAVSAGLIVLTAPALAQQHAVRIGTSSVGSNFYRLAVGAGEKRPVVRDDALAIATVMSCTLSVDHRVVDGAVGAEFLAALKRLLEDPVSMLL